MLRIAFLCFALLTAAAASATVPGFPLGIGYSQNLGFLGQALSSPQAMALATDGSNSPYFLAYTSDTSQLHATATLGATSVASSFILKQSPDGKSIAYLAVLGFQASAMAVDSAGSVYLAGPDFVAKLNTAGSAFVYKFQIGEGLNLVSVAVDQTGRVYVTGYTVTGTIQTTPGAFQQTIPNTIYQHTFVLRLNAAGTAIDYATYLAGSRNDIASGIAVDASGSALVTGVTKSTDFPTTPGAYSTASNAIDGVAFLTRLAPDGSALVYSTLLGEAIPVIGFAVDPNGNAAVVNQAVLPCCIGGSLLRFNAAGLLTFSRTLLQPISSVATDSAGNIYVSGDTELANFPLKNSVSTCTATFSAYLTVFDPAGDLLQSSYLPGGGPTGDGLALGPSSVFVLGSPTVSETGFSLTQLVPNPAAPPPQLVCVGNAASNDPGPIAGGELVSLFGQGLGPAQGAQPQVDVKSGYPSQLANVKVTFNGTAAPLLYVQDSQINAIVPWSMAEAPTVEICVFYNGAETNCLERAVVATAPGIFTTDGYYAAALNQDGTINSAANPAAPGSIVSIFATGLGPIDPQQGDGSIVIPPLPANTLTIQIVSPSAAGGMMVPVMMVLPLQYAGPAPYQVAGVSQINFQCWGGPLEVVGSLFGYDIFGFDIYVAGQSP